MANRFWVGGTASWDATVGTKWALTSGGAGGQAVPTNTDDVFFDAASGAAVVTQSGNRLGRSINFTGFTGTFAQGNNTLTVGDASGGAVTFAAGMTYTQSGATLSFASTSTNGGAGWNFTTAGKTMPACTFLGAGGKWVLQDALTMTGTLTWTAGEFVSNDNSITGTSTATAGTSKVVTLGSSAISLSGQWMTSFAAAGLTMTANTAVVTMTATSAVAQGTANWNGLSLVHAAATNLTVVGGTWANITRTGTAAITDTLSFTNSTTITGTLTVNGNSVNNRVLVQSTTPGVPVTLTCGVVSFSNVNFMDITGAGAASWSLSAITGGSGDCLGNSNITFTTAVDRYLKTAGNLSSTAVWSATSGGATGVTVPLPQDNVFGDANSGAGTYTWDLSAPLHLGKNWDFTGFTRTFTIENGSTNVHRIYGSLTLGSGMTITSMGSLGFMGRTANTITSNGKALTFSSNRSPSFGASGGTTAVGVYTQGDALVINGGNVGLTWNSGTYDTGGYALSVLTTSGSVSTQVLSGAAVTLGSSTVTIGGGSTSTTAWSNASTLLSAASATFVFLATTASRTFAGGGATYGTLTYTVSESPGVLTISGSNTFGTLNVGSGRTLSLTAGSTQNVTNYNVIGTDFNYVYLPGLSTATITVPDSAALSALTDLDLRVKVALDDWTPSATQTLLAKVTGVAGGNQFYRLGVTATTGTIHLVLADGSNATTSTSSVAPALTDGTAYWIRATRRSSDGRVQIFTAPGSLANPITSDWTQVGTDLTNTRVIPDDANLLYIGSQDGSANGIGKFYRAQIRNNVLDDGTGIVFDADLSTKTVGANTFTESSSNAATVTITGALAQVGDGRIVIGSTTAAAAVIAKPTIDSYGNSFRYWGTTLTMNSDSVVLTGASGNYLDAVDSTALSITGDIDIRVRVAMADWTPAAQTVLVNKGLNPTVAASVSYVLFVNADGTLRLGLSDGATFATPTSSVATGISDGATGWVRATWRKSDGRVQFFTASGALANPVAADFTQLGTNQTSTGVVNVNLSDSAYALAVGSDGISDGRRLTGTLYAVEIRNGIDGTLVANPRFGRGEATNQSNYAVITASRAIGAANWYAPPPSVDGGTNYGWIFTTLLSGNFFQMF